MTANYAYLHMQQASTSDLTCLSQMVFLKGCWVVFFISIQILIEHSVS